MNEKQLSITLGLSRERLKAIREGFIQNKDWKKIESKKPYHLWAVEWSEEGINKLRKYLQMDEIKEPITPPSEIDGKVHCKYKNNKIIGVMVDNKLENVLCRDSIKFVVGMSVKMKWDGIRWVVSRHPRFNGKY